MATSNCEVAILDFTLTPVSYDTFTHSACQYYAWNGQVYTASGIYTGTTTNCTTELLDLTIEPIVYTISTVSACDSYTWNGQVLTTSGVYPSQVVNCSLNLLNLTITPSSFNTTSITSSGSYVWMGTTYTASGVYTAPVSNCVTEVLDLTITCPTVVTSNAVLCPGNAASVTLVGNPAGGVFSVQNPYTGPATTYTYTYTNPTNGCNGTAIGSIVISTVNPAVITTPIAASITSATVCWTPVPGATLYYLWYRKVTTPASAWLTPTVAIGSCLNLTGLSPNTLYECRIRNNNAACNQLGAFGPVVTFTTGNLPCASPTTLNPIVIVPVNKAQISWTPLAGTSQYSVHYKRTSSATWSTYLGSATSLITATLSPGTYEVKIRNKCAGSNSFSAFGPSSTFTIGASNKQINLARINSFNLFPNPTSDDLNIEVTSEKESNTIVKLYDLTGRLIKQIQAKTIEGVNHLSLRIGDLATGIYTVKIYENDQLAYSSKVAKQD